VKNPYPESLPSHRYEDGGKPLATKWQTHPVTGVTTVTVLADRAYMLIEPIGATETRKQNESIQATDAFEMNEPAMSNKKPPG